MEQYKQLEAPFELVLTKLVFKCYKTQLEFYCQEVMTEYYKLWINH